MSVDPPAVEKHVETVAALAAIARTVAMSVDVEDVFARVVAATRPLLPFDRMGACWMEGPSALHSRDLSGRGEARLL
jgi:hypothetical protein